MTGTGCMTPLDEVELSMFVDGDSDAAVIDHIQGCADCRARAAALQRTQQQWQALFYRHSCPTPDDLCDYGWQFLSAAQRAAIADHLQGCPHCTHELLNNYIRRPAINKTAAVATAARWSTPIGPINFMESGSAHLQAPALSYAVREGKQTNQITIAYPLDENATLYAITEEDANYPGRYRLELRILGLDTDGMEVQVWRQNHLVHTALLDAGGDAFFTNLPAELYEIILNTPSLKVHIPQVAIGVPPPTPDPQSPLSDWE